MPDWGAELRGATAADDSAGGVDWGKELRGETTPPTAAPTLDDRAQKFFGLDPEAKRLNVLPYPAGALKEDQGPIDWKDWTAPQIVEDLAKGVLLPGHVAAGGTATPEDVTKFGIDYATPLSAASAIGRATGKRAVREAAPSTEELKSAASAKYGAAGDSGVVVSPDSYADFLAKMEAKAYDEGLAVGLHPKLVSAVSEIQKGVGSEVGIDRLQIARRQLGVAARSAEPDERRIADNLIDLLDDYIDGLTPGDLVSGDPTGVGRTLADARGLWSRARKSETIEKIIENAEMQASGIENGIRIGLRSLLKNEKKMRGFTQEEKATMQKIIRGGPVQNILRLVGKFAPMKTGATNVIGGTLAGAGGFAAGDMGGSLAALTAAQMGQGAARRGTMRGIEYLRALAATGGKRPRAGGGVLRPTTRSLGRLGAMGLAGKIEPPKKPAPSLFNPTLFDPNYRI